MSGSCSEELIGDEAILFSLFEATNLSTSWTITGHTSGSSSVTITWSGFPNNLNATYFIISLNETMPQAPSYVHDYHYNNYKPRVFLHMVNSNHSSSEVEGLSMFTEYSATVFLVDTAFDIYNSQTIRVQTGEGCKYALLPLFLLKITKNFRSDLHSERHLPSKKAPR